jgi:hypothetical protein
LFSAGPSIDRFLTGLTDTLFLQMHRTHEGLVIEE